MTDDLRKQLLVKGQGLSLKGMRYYIRNEDRAREKKFRYLSLSLSGARWNLKRKEGETQLEPKLRMT